MVDALAVRGDEGRGSLRKAWVRWQTTVITRDIRMGKPTELAQYL
jgi:hypothetical protein